MKLISLYIENFGGLSRYSLELQEGLTVLREPNGFGKTSLAEFIRAMFYGFPRRGKTLEKDRRQHYTPWSGNKAGGNLVFETDGRRYRIERTFGADPKGDTFRLIDLSTDQKSTRFSKDIGLELFGLDADAFERSTYLPQLQDPGPLATDSIRAKLSNLVEDTGDIGNYEKAVAALKEQRSAYQLYRGTGGSVAQAQNQITLLQEQLDRARDQERQLESLQAQLSELSQKTAQSRSALGRIRTQITQASGAAAAKAVHDRHEELSAQLRRTQLRLEELDRTYPKGLPEEGELDRIQRLAHQRELLAEEPGMTPEERQTLDALRSRAGALEESRLSHLEAQSTGLAQARQRLAQLPISQPNKRSLLPLLLALILGLGATAAGIVLLAARHWLPGGAALALGICALGAAVVLLIRRMLDRALQGAPGPEHSALTLQIRQQEASLREQLQGREDFDRAIWELRQAREQLAELERKQAAQQDRDRKLRDCDQALEAFTLAWALDPNGPLPALLVQLRRDGVERSLLCSRCEEQRQALEDHAQRHAQVLAQPRGNVPGDLAQLEREERRLTQELEMLKDRELALGQRCQSLREAADRIPELEESLAQWQEKKAADQRQVRLLDDTVQFLEQAQKNLALSYRQSIADAFAQYLSLLAPENQEGLLVDQSLQVQLQRQGQSRELAYFSAGQQDLVMLCMRLALVDALFREEQPFLILDDPFVNLDDAAQARAMALLRQVSQQRQILYMTCHSSRA